MRKKVLGMNDLDHVVVSGADQGMGKAVAPKLGRYGIDVLCICKTTNGGVTASESFCAAF